MSSEQNKALIARLYDEVFVKWNLAFLDEVIDPEFIEHSSPPRGAKEIRQFYQGLRTVFPDLKYTVEDLIAEGDKVVVRWQWSATHKGKFLGIPATGKEAPMTGIAIYRIRGNRIVERWVEVGLIGLVFKLGATLKVP